jgi:hypothetical protein
VSRYALKWLPQGAIPRDIDMKVTMQPAVVPGESGAGKCVKAFAGYAVNGAATYNPTESAGGISTWNWPCNGGGWSIVVTGFGIPCGGVYSWSHSILSDVTLSSHLTFTEGTDALGHPTLTIAGDSDTCLNVGEILQVSLALNGDASFGEVINFRKQPDPITVTFLGANQVSGANWSYGWDGTNLNIFVRDPGNAEYQFMFQATGAESGGVTWFYDTGPIDPDTSISVSSDSIGITFDVNYTGGGVGMPLAISFYCQDAVVPIQTAPAGAPVSQFHING